MTGLRIFTIGGVPVWVSPWFFLLGLVYVRMLGFKEGVIVTLCAGISILVHELGHALVASRYRLSPQILLHGLGGLCAHDRAERDRHDALILFAGPFAGLLLGFAALGVQLALEAGGVAISPEGGLVFQVMLYINIGWSLVNLLPMWPLDGGRLFRLGLLQFLRPLWAERVTHATAIVLLGSGAAFGFKSGSTMLGIMALYFLMQNLRVLLGEAQGDIVRGRNPRAKAMLADIQAAYEAGNDTEVLLRGHRLREESHLPEAVVRKLFAMLGVSTARLGRHSEALSYLQRGETNPDVVEAAIECLHMLDRDAELRALLASKAFQLLSATRRQEILEVLDAEA